jgi:hypothetical protein
MTLDHVAPRLGQSAYDRRDNLVLACSGCNAKKKDLAPLAFLLASRGRAVNLLRYGSHLSPMLVELARQLVPPALHPPGSGAPTPSNWGERLEAGGESPYRD